MALKIGDKAPDFKLMSSDLKETSLSDYKGQKVVVHFFPLAFTGVCTEQLCTLRDSFGYYNDGKAQIVAISVDSPFCLDQFKKAQNYQFPLLSDFNKTTSTAYGACYEEFVMGLKGVSKRSAFVVNEEGNIIYAEVLEDAKNLPDFEAIKNVL